MNPHHLINLQLHMEVVVMKKLIGGILLIFFCVSIMGYAANNGCTSNIHQTITEEIEQSNMSTYDKYPTPPFKSWGLGKVVSKQVSLNTDYDWYIDQMHTGYNSDSNCGPACTIMAAKWSNESFTKSVTDARNSARNIEVGGWWYIKNIHSFLVNNDIPSFRDHDITIDKAIDQLDKGKILILNVYTGYITRNKNLEERTGRFYDEKTGHFIILKGYRIVDHNIYFEVYDPNNFERYYMDGTEKGKNRYYLATEVISSVKHWWDEYLVISHK